MLRELGKAALELLALVALLGLLAACGPPRDEPEAVARHFIQGLVHASAQQAKEVTTTEQWTDIDRWMERRTPFECPAHPFGFRFDLAEESTHGRAASGSVEEGTWSFEYYAYECITSSPAYEMIITDLVLIESDAGWKVVDWGWICDTNGISIKLCR